MTDRSRQDWDSLVQDYVLGLLTPKEADSFEQLLESDDALKGKVRDLRERLLELDITAAPEAYSDDLWSKIEKKLGKTADDTVVNLETRRPLAKPISASGYWRGFATAAIAASLLFAAMAGTFFALRTVAEPVVIAILVDGDANPGVIVEAFGKDRVRIVPLVDIPVPQGQALEVWTLPDPETGPVSLGLMPASAESSLGGFDLPRPNAEQLYEITLEPETGSPTGRPTGPVLFKGFAKVPL
jgi:anti-sigma-K factor RskA